MKKGSTGITILVTMASTTCWNSSSSPVMASAFTQVAARPTSTERTRAAMTDITGVISSLNSSSGSWLSPPAADWMDRLGMIP